MACDLSAEADVLGDDVPGADTVGGDVAGGDVAGGEISEVSFGRSTEEIESFLLAMLDMKEGGGGTVEGSNS